MTEAELHPLERMGRRMACPGPQRVYTPREPLTAMPWLIWGVLAVIGAVLAVSATCLGCVL